MTLSEEISPEPKKEILVGGIYMHQNNSEHRYQVLRTGLIDDATGWEKTHKIKPRVEYVQLYDEDFPS